MSDIENRFNGFKSSMNEDFMKLHQVPEVPVS